jgi:isopenicillin N synthase-like dioxygenase
MTLARRHAISFFQLPFEEKEATRVLYRGVGGGQGHCGYNKPSRAKENYRVRLPVGGRGTADTNAEIEALWACPGAGSTEGGREAAAVVSCMWAPAVQVFGVLDALLQVVLDCLLTDMGLDAARFRALCCDKTTSTDHSTSSTNSRTDSTTSSTDSMTSSTHSSDSTAGQVGFTESVLDLFHYNNTDMTAEVPNLDPHYDPGLLTAVPCAKVAGLQVRCRLTQQWVAVEEGVAKDPTDHIDLSSFPPPSLPPFLRPPSPHACQFKDR